LAWCTARAAVLVGLSITTGYCDDFLSFNITMQYNNVLAVIEGIAL
jgi:hypothetical protein